MNTSSCPDFADLLGKTIVFAERYSEGDDYIDFVLDTGERFRMIHFQDCCESVVIEDINGNLRNLKGVVKLAEESVSDHRTGEPQREENDGSYDFSNTWTFYRIATDSEHVDIRWWGSSNGYYSESVDWMLVTE